MPKILFLGLLLFVACQPASDYSKPQGHFENMSEQDAEMIAQTMPMVIEEHGSTDFVAISAALVMPRNMSGYARSDMALAILKGGAGLVVFVNPGMTDPLNHPDFSEFKVITEGFHDRIRFVESKNNIPTVWARDWAPLQALNSSGEKILLDFNYYPSRPVDDFTPSILADLSSNTTRLSVPVYNEGGNFMSNSRGVCMMTSRVVEANQSDLSNVFVDSNGNIIFGDDGYPVIDISADRRRDQGGRRIQGTLHYDLENQIQIRTDDRILSEAEIVDYYKRYAGCKDVHIFPRMPEEGTGHIDMFAKFLDDDTILINEISNAQIEGLSSLKEQQLALEIKDYLTDIVARLSQLGFKLVTVPMPIPQLRTVNYEQGSYDYFVMRSYSNSLLVNRSGRKLAIVPRYSAAYLFTDESSATDSGLQVQAYTDEQSIADYEQSVIAAYSLAEYEVVFIDSDELIANGGAVHCTTMQFAYPL